MISPSSLSIDQLLRAAQLLEQQQTQAALQIGIMGSPQLQPMQFCKLGEDYQERLVASKMRSAIENPQGASSTGSSRRSSPISGMFSNCSSAQSSSPPNSPSTILMSSMPVQVASSSFNTSINCSDGSTPYGNGNISPHSNASMSTRQSRAAHNELEKNRRANLRSYLDNLKSVLPADADSTRDTTLSLLTRARNYLKAIREQKDQLVEQRNAMLAEHLSLCKELEDNEQAELPQPAAPIQKAPVECSLQTQAPVISHPPCDITSAIVAKLCFTPPATFFEQLNLGCNTSPSAFSSPMPEKKTLNLYMDGLLPALPLLYPYTNKSFGLSC